MQEEHLERASAAFHGPDLHARLLLNTLRARLISARMVALQRAGRIGGHTPSIGDEAVVVGAALAAREGDVLFPGVREWYVALARGMDLSTYIHHAFGTAEDPAKGHAPPDHPPARAFGVVPPSGVVGAHLPQAVGYAWARTIAARAEKHAVLALFGAKVKDAGDFHNALNFAGVFRAPVVFVCRGPVAETAIAYGLASAKVDGGDAVAVHDLVAAALARASEGKGATLIEATMPPLGAIDDLDDAALVGDAILDLGATDPLVRLAAGTALDARAIRAELDTAIADAEQAGPPARATIFDDVFASVPPHLARQRGG